MTATFDLRPGARVREYASVHQRWFVALLFGILMTTQAMGLLVFGTGRVGLGVSECIIVIEGLLAIVCTWIAFRRARGITALFWFLFVGVLTILLVPTALQAYDTLFEQSLVSESTRGLLYCLYGAPILLMLFLPETSGRTRVKAEIFLDFFQVSIVVALVYSTFFFLPVRQMLPADALLRNISISDAQSLLLLVATLIRLQFARVPGMRDLLLRLAIFLTVCAIATFAGDLIYVRYGQYSSLNAWFDLGWAIPQVIAGLIAVTFTDPPKTESASEPAGFFGFLGTNLVLVAMLSCIGLLMDYWKQAFGSALAHSAIAASLVAFTVRLALTQFHQQQEIAHRKSAQLQLTASHEKVGRLLEDAQRQTAEITQVSELGSLLHACTSRGEVFRLVPERLRRLFPGASGSISLLSASKNRVETAAEWGICPADQIFSPDQCWALRRGCTHAHPGGHSQPRCSHLLGEGPSVCIPLIANSDTFGTFSIQNDDRPSSGSLREHDVDALARRRHLAAAVAEHIALAVANLGLRESLRLEAVRDPLTGLYNRRYMQEFLDRELHSARRKRRPLAVMMLDLDHFKRYNDNFGHNAGDQALAAVGEMLLRSVRAEDIACRFGGEEFTLILPECSLSQATVRAEEIRERVKQYRTQPDNETTDLSFSIGVAAFDETTDRVDLLLKFADEALYQAKHAGRDRVVAARPAAALPELNFTQSASAIVSSTPAI